MQLIHDRDVEKSTYKKIKLDNPNTSVQMTALQECEEITSHGNTNSSLNSGDCRDKASETKQGCFDDLVKGESSHDDWEDFSDDSKMSSEYLRKKLREVDPEMAERLHPNNRRKILR